MGPHSKYIHIYISGSLLPPPLFAAFTNELDNFTQKVISNLLVVHTLLPHPPSHLHVFRFFSTFFLLFQHNEATSETVENELFPTDTLKKKKHSS